MPRLSLAAFLLERAGGGTVTNPAVTVDALVAFALLDPGLGAGGLLTWHDKDVAGKMRPAFARLLASRQPRLLAHGRALSSATGVLGGPVPGGGGILWTPPPFPVVLAAYSLLCLSPAAAVGDKAEPLSVDQRAVVEALLKQGADLRALVERILTDNAVKSRQFSGLYATLTGAAKRLVEVTALFASPTHVAGAGGAQTEQQQQPPAKRQRRLSRDERRREFRGRQDVLVRVAGDEEPLVLNVRQRRHTPFRPQRIELLDETAP
jgi:hypothetical protein